MATVKTARICLEPANSGRDGEAWCIVYSLKERSPEMVVEFTTLDGLQRQVEAFVANHAADEAYAYGCYAHVAMQPRTARKPAGFDAWRNDRAHTFFNLKPKAWGA